ncbi:hypothetical protein BD626DRAFT_485438 [Schizophyllum amplum]|uniref:Poly A polymerase head domain-containing protein n=1 Tax=Schizophyllum amplum TaxID=97359 RepID=A0A550CLL6_9AGAR|nr:hypothetical protein BD626DRAFT_485438 [Auriculariopsis ampla]
MLCRLQKSLLSRAQLYRKYATRSMSLRSSPRQRIAVPQELTVRLTDDEDRLCTLLDDCANYLRDEKGITTSCRIAGGWVRDKLLGSQSNDIDVALSDVLGLTFAEHLAEFAKERGEEMGAIGQIKANPNQSKHLATATCKIHGYDVDLVNLRSEEYATDSRIPTEMAFGTPLQDALRRDITINALFYNIHERAVEDFTEKGMQDLRNGIVRTPLPPRETFLDDPLRVLRCLRFATRFGFDIVPELVEAAKDPVVQQALVSKISRERVGEEFTKMMKGADPVRAVELIDEYGLYPAIFNAVVPPATLPKWSGQPASPTRALASTIILRAVLAGSSLLPPVDPAIVAPVSADPTARPRLYLACALSPYLGLTYMAKKKEAPAVECVIRECLKLGVQNHFLDGVPLLFTAVDVLRNPVFGSERLTMSSERLAIGSLLRHPSVHNRRCGIVWTESVLFALVTELSAHYDPAKDELDSTQAARIITTYNAFARRVEELDLGGAGDARPILDGREVVSLLGAAKPGPWTGAVLARVVDWQLEHPEGAKDACAAWLKDEHAAGRLEVDLSSGEPPAKKVKKSR